jgi:hypothetical protein
MPVRFAEVLALNALDQSLDAAVDPEQTSNATAPTIAAQRYRSQALGRVQAALGQLLPPMAGRFRVS